MAWIMKNSGGMQIERRDEPYLNDALKQRLESEVMPHYPEDHRRAAALPVMHVIQEEHGYLPMQAIEEAADFLNVSAAELLDTVSFYEEFWTQPHGKYVIWVCQSLSCEILGSNTLTERIADKLGIEPGETTEDGKFTLMHVECLGSCGTAPCALVNEKLHENINIDNFEQVLDSLE